jgi:hypothetical protein
MASGRRWPTEIRQGPATRGSVRVLEHEGAVGDGFEGLEVDGAHQRGFTTVAGADGGK